MDPLDLCIALGPVAVYVLLIGLINLSRQPFLTTALRDAAALAVAISGLAVVGPLKLFVPEAAIGRFDSFVWLMLLALYALGATLVILTLRPRLVLYNVTMDQLRPVLGTVVQQLDTQARWAADSLVMPQLGVQLHLEEFPLMRNTQLVSSGPGQSLAGWRRLEMEMRRSLAGVRVAPNLRGASMMVIALGMAVWIVVAILSGQPSLDEVKDAIGDFLHFR